MQIDKKFLFNFTQEEKEQFKNEQEYLEFCQTQSRYNVSERMSDLAIKYQINRILLNDKNLTEANFSGCTLSDAQAYALGNAFKKNSHCKYVILSNTTISPTATRELALALAVKILKHINVSGMTENEEEARLSHKKEWRFLYFMFAPTCRWNSITISNTKRNHQKVNDLSAAYYGQQGSIFFANTARPQNESFKIKFNQNISKITALILGKNRQKEQ